MSANVVVLETNFGNIELTLNTEKAPISSANFLKYVDENFYDGTIFHRVIGTFMIQGGGMNEDMSQKKTHGMIKNEAKNGLANKRGSVAMARTNVVDSASSQFFINVVDNSFLNYRDDANYGYAVFAEVTAGMETVDKIKAVKTGSRSMHQDVPLDPVKVISARRKVQI